MQEVAHISSGQHPGNCISLLRVISLSPPLPLNLSLSLSLNFFLLQALNASQNNMLILQESCTDSSGSMVVYAPIDLPAINIVMSGEDPSYIPLLPSGFTILPDEDAAAGRPFPSPTAASSSASGGGSLITVAFQILVSSLPSSRLNLESVTTVNNLISTTVQQIKAAWNCPSL